jgi:hypothetical protein
MSDKRFLAIMDIIFDIKDKLNDQEYKTLSDEMMALKNERPTIQSVNPSTPYRAYPTYLTYPTFSNAIYLAYPDNNTPDLGLRPREQGLTEFRNHIASMYMVFIALEVSGITRRLLPTYFSNTACTLSWFAAYVLVSGAKYIGNVYLAIKNSSF